jgi:hypothetical protein
MLAPDYGGDYRVASTAFERVLGTIAGGITGFIVRCIGEAIDVKYEWLMYGIAAGFIGGFGVWLGQTTKLGSSPKLLVITFLLVFVGGQNPV